MPDNLNDLDKKLAQYRKTDADRSAHPAPKRNDGAQAGMEFVAEILVGCGGGWFLDRWLGTSPWLFLLGFFLGVAAGFYSLFKMARNLNAPSLTALPKGQKTATKPPEISDDDDV
jgi:ATP synthase protein I